MSYGVANGKSFGFSNCVDWLNSVILSFPEPWSVIPLKGKYYGTKIQDGRGVPILSVWRSEGNPSHREKALFGEWTPEAWADYCCDTHWESEQALSLAEFIVAGRNACESDYASSLDELALTILCACRWEEDCWPEIHCGGPNKRDLSSAIFTRHMK